MKFIQEFKTFAFKGNVIDLAVGVIIGAAFGKIVSSLVEDVITPLLLNPALDAVGAKNIAQLSWHGVTYGNFLSAVISFLCIALVLFWLIKRNTHETEKTQFHMDRHRLSYYELTNQ
jgi:large conductance mechanosensitive channel